jgi:branched-chain amino acid transport system ATP-binding protein
VAAGEGDMTLLELQGLHKHFGAAQVLRGVSLSVGAGERVALIGPNGAGKSTLFNLVSGRDRPGAGQVLLHGRRVDGLAPHQLRRRGLARSFQVSQLFARLSVVENLRCAVSCNGSGALRFWRSAASDRDTCRQAQDLLEQLNLQHRADVPAGQLSYAEQRALELGLTVAGGAELLLLDEPTAGMSRSETGRCVALIRSLCVGRSLLMVEHDMGVVFELADRVAVLVAGELIAFDTPQRVRADPRVQAAYLGAALADR